MLKGRGRDPRGVTAPLPGHHTTTRPPGVLTTPPPGHHTTTRPPGVLTTPPPGHPNTRASGVTSPTPVHLNTRLTVTSPTPGHRTVRSPGPINRAGPQQRPLPSKPEPDYEVVEFPSDQYVNAKLQPPPPPPPRPPTGHPAQAGASCGLCGGGGARVRCAECGRRALCASCDDMYHRHPKRRHHQRQALSLSQLGEDRPPLPPKGTPPVPPPRRNKMNASPMPPMTPLMQDRRATLAHGQTMAGMRASASPTLNHQLNPSHQLNQTHQMNQNHMNQAQPMLVQAKMVNPGQMGSMPFLPTAIPLQHQMQQSANTLGHLNAGWNRPRGSLQGFNAPQVQEVWDGSEGMPPTQGWARPMRRGASVLELGGGCAGCAHCAPPPAWRYGSCATLDQPWGAWPPQCCPPHGHAHQHVPHTPQPYRRADSRAMSRAASRTGSRAASPALSVRSRASRRTKHRTPSPPLPSSDADSESESESEPAPKSRDHHSRPERPSSRSERPDSNSDRPNSNFERPPSRSDAVEDSLGPIPPAPDSAWQCEHCTYVNKPGVRVCVICCRTPTAAPKVVTEVTTNFERMKIASRQASPVLEKVEQERFSSKQKKEHASTGCGPSPPRNEKVSMKSTQRLVTPTREQNGSNAQSRHDMAVGPSPPRDTRSNHNSADSSRDRREPIRASPNTDTKEAPQRHSVSVGPSPPKENSNTGQKKSAGTSPSRDVRPESRSSTAGKTNVSNTGTSPPPQSISTQTYEDPSTYERAGSVARSRPRRRFRDDRRERSRSRHSLSSDTRESERSVRTTGAWEWRERDSSPTTGGEWGGRLARRASHLDLRRRDVRAARRTSLYGSEAPSPEPPSNGRAISMEVLSGGRNAERGLELARLLAEAERLGYSAAEVQVGLAQSPGAPVAWLRSRWAGLVGAVVGAAARLAPHSPLSEAAARAALARHRGAVWPAVTECVDTLRRQTEPVKVSGEGRMRGRVWGSPAGADDDAAPRAREDSSDEYEAPPPRLDEWYPVPGYDDPGAELWSVPPDPVLAPLNLDPKEMALWDVPPDTPSLMPLANEVPLWNDTPDPTTLAPLTLNPKEEALWSVPPDPAPLTPLTRDTEDVALKLRSLLLQAGIPSIDENLLLKGLLANGAQTKLQPEPIPAMSKSSLDMIQSENDFIDAYNALTRASPLPNINKPNELETETIYTGFETQVQNIKKDETHQPHVKDSSKISNRTSHHHHKHKQNTSVQNIEQTLQDTSRTEIKPEDNEEKAEEAVSNQNNSSSQDNKFPSKSPLPRSFVNKIIKKDTIADQSNIQPTKQADEKSSNLNEIVDNTQKLIQQMKEEINSDIHSLDDGHSQTSQSDLDTSSHDEQESSYSESEEETNHTSITSDEKEVTSSSSEEERIDENHRNETEFVNRTSSEDNEQFEEALDNLDNQIEDVKHANIEILDSIARSLQEEHTISVELNETKETSIELKDSHIKPIMIVNPHNENDMKRDYTQDIPTVVETPKENNIRRGDTNNNRFVAVNSFDEIYEELNTTNVIEKPASQNNNIEPMESNNIQNENEVIEHIPVVEPKILFTKYLMNESVFKIVSPTKIYLLDAREPTYNAVIENTEVLENGFVENATEVLHQNTDSDNTSQTENAIETQEVFDTEANNDSNATENVKSNTPERTGTELIGNDVPVIDSSPERYTALVDKEPESNNIIPQNKLEPNQNGIIKKQPSPDKTPMQTNDGNSKSSKSGIPKPVRTTPNNKPKNEKMIPKVLASKVPVRRGSIKQYHAPAPPKAHFGNVQSGHVKQLQSKLQLFNAKPAKSQVTEIEVKPSTSTASLKKNPAPQPPRKDKQQSPPKSSPPREKNNYFRETCRTEDEWTESDSDESQIIRQTSVEEVKPAEPSPPPPVTLRRVSGNIIDLAQVRLPEGSPERQARMLLAEGATETWEQARLALELVTRGAELPAALLAALECADLSAALAYLHQDCELCAERYPEYEMVSMLRCTHRCCGECARLYFTVQITERSIADCVCPFCKMPELEPLSEDAWLEYFAHLDIQLKALLETDVHELFQRKLRDRTLAMDPNFRWCMECSSGFFVHPKQKKLRCPECRSVSCASCRKSWSSNHEGLSCEQYAAWLADNDPEISVAAVQQHLRENGLECPRCHFKYSLSRGGCMHFTCTQCKFEFCYGCGKPFTMGARCGLSEYCAKLGLHAHHPRNCLFYLRDKEPHELQTLLQMNNVTYETEAAEGSNGRCPIPLQRETPTGLVDGICGSEAPPKYAGLCKNHYLEYLTRQVRWAGADPLPILGIDDLETLVRRAGQRLPPRPYGSLDGLYRSRLTEIVKEKIPLD